jgi:ABC-type bacteriocin/lantibiotic exporter with double-glycine peptidase domain
MRFLNDIDAMRLMRTLDTQDVAFEEREGGRPVEGLADDIRFDGVSFSYGPDRPVLFDVDLVIPRGKVTFLIGRSGAGKSTLLDLLMRLQRPTEGRITVGGSDISDFNLVQWRRTFGYVSQDAALFNGAVRMNLALAKPDATEEELVEACRLAGIHEFIQSLPDGYDTVVGDRGHSVSGGQRKRIAIARALMHRPQVLILDEATTSFEQTLEAELIARLLAAIPNLTVIQVTHRLQTASTADFVIVLEHGRVIATGSWEEVRQHEIPSSGGTP